MAERYEVWIQVKSVTGGETFVQEAEGTVYQKDGVWYLRYAETDADGKATSTFVKLGDAEWSVRRSGAVDSVMVFAQDSPRRGHYRTLGLDLPLTTRLRATRLDLAAGQGIVSLDYDLSIGDGPPERHQIRYRIRHRTG
jgi:uncharacterized beta-barrel protein YwiB (DUF1934 family)